MIDKNIVVKKLSNWLGLKTELFEKINYSTNDRVKELIQEGYPDSLVAAEFQDGGKGRVGRSWISTTDSIALSFSIHPGIDITKFPRLTPLVADSVAKVLGDRVCIKWPNDILIDGKKICGILCELYTYDNVNYVVVGIGINVGTFDYEARGIKNATSLENEGIFISKADIISEIYNVFNDKLKVFEKEGFRPFAREYSNRLNHIGKRVTLLDSSTHNGNIDEADVILSGLCKGVSDNGELIVEAEDGIHLISTGELSLRIH